MAVTEQDKLFASTFRFALYMMEKLLIKAVIEGRKGWDDSEWIESGEAGKMLLDHAKKLADGDLSQAVDVANFAMFIHAYTVREGRDR